MSTRTLVVGAFWCGRFIVFFLVNTSLGRPDKGTQFFRAISLRSRLLAPQQTIEPITRNGVKCRDNLARKFNPPV